MATNWIATTPLLGVNVEGVDTPNAADPLIAVAGGAPRIQVNTTVILVGTGTAAGNRGVRFGRYVVCNTQINPSATCTVSTGGSVTSTTGTGQFLSINTTTASTGDFIYISSPVAPSGGGV